MVDKILKFKLLKPPSLNAYYAGGHWAVRKKSKDTNLAHIKEQFRLSGEKFTCEGFEINLVYNSRYDCDNAIIAIKFLSDAIVSLGYAPDDTKKFFKRLTIEVNTELKSNTFIAYVNFYNTKNL